MYGTGCAARPARRSAAILCESGENAEGRMELLHLACRQPPPAR